MLVRQFHTVAPVLLGFVKRPVSGRDQRDDVGTRLAAGHANAHRRTQQLIGDHDSCRLEGGADAFCRNRRLVGGSRQDGNELLAAEPAKQIRRPHVDARHRGEQAQGLVAHRVAEAIVDPLEIVEIEYQHTDRLTPFLQPVDEQRGPGQNPRRFNTPVRSSVDAASLWMRTDRSLDSTSTMNAVPTT